MNQKTKIREYVPGDKESVMEIMKMNIPKYFAESEINDLDNYLKYETEKYFVAEIDNKIVGAGGINFEDSSKAKISWDFVNPKYQGLGVGKELLNHRLNILKSMKNINEIIVRTSQMAYKFYEKNGFILKKVTKDYWSKNFDLYLMIYKL